jgi:hypothetical protein
MFTHPCVIEKVAVRYELLRGDLNSDVSGNNHATASGAPMIIQAATGVVDSL